MYPVIWFDENGEIPEGTALPKVHSIGYPWERSPEDEETYYPKSGIWSGVKDQPHLGDLNFYKFPPVNTGLDTITIFGPALPAISNADVKWFVIQISETNSAFMQVSNIYKGKFNSELSTSYRNSFEGFAKGFRAKLRRHHIKDIIEPRRAGGKRGRTRLVPWWSPFSTKGWYSSGNACFVNLETWSDFCGLKDIGEIFKMAPLGTDIPTVCHPLILHIGVPKLLKFNMRELFEIGLEGRVFWGDPAFPPSNIKSRLFLLFGLKIIFFGHKLGNLCVAQQYLATLEAPTAGCLQFSLLKKGSFLYREKIVKKLLKHPPTAVRVIIRSMSAFQYSPHLPVILGQMSYPPMVMATLQPATKKIIKIEKGGKWE